MPIIINNYTFAPKDSLSKPYQLLIIKTNNNDERKTDNIVAKRQKLATAVLLKHFYKVIGYIVLILIELTMNFQPEDDRRKIRCRVIV